MYKYRVFIKQTIGTQSANNNNLLELDTNSSESIPLCFQYNTMDFKFNTSFSYTYKIPLTYKNKNILGFYVKNNMLYSVREKYYPVSVTMDDRLIFSGVIKVSDVSKDSVTCSFEVDKSSNIHSLSNIKLWQIEDNIDLGIHYSGTKDIYNLQYNNGVGRTTGDYNYVESMNTCFFPKLMYEDNQYKDGDPNFGIGDGNNQPVGIHNELLIDDFCRSYNIDCFINNRKMNSFIPEVCTQSIFIPDKLHFVDSIKYVDTLCCRYNYKMYSFIIAPILGVTNRVLDPDTKWFSKSDTYKETFEFHYNQGTQHITFNCRYPNSSNSDCDIIVSKDSTIEFPKKMFSSSFYYLQNVRLFLNIYNKKTGNFWKDTEKKYLTTLNSETSVKISDYLPDGIIYKKDGTMYFFSVEIESKYVDDSPMDAKLALINNDMFYTKYNIYFDGKNTLSDRNDISRVYSQYMPDISINDFLISYANIINKGTIYYDTRTSRLMIKGYDNIKNVIDISNYVSEITKQSKLFDEHNIYMYCEENSSKINISKFTTNEYSNENNELYKSIFYELRFNSINSLYQYDFVKTDGAASTIGRSDSFLYPISTFFCTNDGSSYVDGSSIVYAKPVVIDDLLRTSNYLPSMFYNNEKVELTIKCSSKMVFDILDFNSRLKVQQLGSEFILNKATLTKDGAKLVLIAI